MFDYGGDLVWLPRLTHLNKPFGDCQPLPARSLKLLNERPDASSHVRSRGKEFVIRMRRKAIDELQILKIMRSPHHQRISAGRNHQGKTRIKGIVFIIAPREKPPDLIGLDKRAAMHSFIPTRSCRARGSFSGGLASACCFRNA